MPPSEILRMSSCVSVGAPLLAAASLGLASLATVRLSERVGGGIARLAMAVSFAASVVCAGIALQPGWQPVRMPLVEWFRVGEVAFELAIVSDRLTLVLLPLVSGLTLLATYFSRNYLHRDSGFVRFHLLVSVFGAGMLWAVVSASLEQLFVGWELVGVSSALLVGFFQERRAPTQAGVRVFTTYRLCDLGILLAVPALHHAVGSAELTSSGAEPAVYGLPAVGGAAGTWIGLSILLSAIGKSAQLPVGSWLPRAMEGPTPSSALFYGGISVHAGVFLLLRSAPLLAASPVASVLVGLCGLATAVYAGFVVRVQSDVKSTLAFATMSQVGVMLLEIAAGFHTLALVHLVSHAILRVYQLLRAPSALSDAIAIDSALGLADPAQRTPRAGLGASAMSRAWRRHVLPRYLYRVALERVFLDTLQSNWFLQPVLSLSRRLEGWERRWIERFDGDVDGAPPEVDPEAMGAPRSQP